MGKFNTSVGNIVNFVGFNAVWLVCVQANDYYAVAALVLFLAIHFYRVNHNLNELYLITGFSIVGYCSDSAMATMALYELNGQRELDFLGFEFTLAPVWMLCLWLAFSTTLSHSLAWIKRKKAVGLILVAISVPLSYYTGAAFSGSIIFTPVYYALLVETVIWLTLLPVGLYFAHFITSKNSCRLGFANRAISGA